MAQFGMRTCYGEKDLERASLASGKIVGMYESMTKRGCLADNLDSGLGAEVEDSELSLGEGPPTQPKLIGDTEVQDSGLGDDVEVDRVAAGARSPREVETVIEAETPLTSLKSSGRSAVDKPVPRRPWKTIVPGRKTQLQYSRPTDATGEGDDRSATAGLPRAGAVPEQAASEISRLEAIRLQNQWRRVLLQQQLNYLLPNRDGDTGIHLAVIHARPDILTQLLALVATDPRLQPALDEQNSLYQTALHLATHTQQVDLIQRLLAAGASPELTDHKGNTPLHIACRFSSTKCLDELVRGVPLERVVEAAYIRNHLGQTCVHVATERGNTDALRKLKSIGIDMNVEDFHSGKAPLHLAVEKCSLTDVQFLTETCQVDINRETYAGCTPLHTAAGRGNIAVVAYLLSMGADPDIHTDEGDTALDLAGSDQVATILTKAAALRWLNA